VRDNRTVPPDAGPHATGPETSDVHPGLPDPAAVEPLEVTRVASNLPFVLRTFLGLAVLGVGTNIVGVVIVGLMSWAMNTEATHSQLTSVLTASIVATAVALVLGVSSGALVQRRTLRWLLRGEQPSAEDARLAVRMPRDMAVITAVLWLLGAVAIGIVGAAIDLTPATVFGLVGGTILAGLASAGLINLLMWRVNQTVVRLALAAVPPEQSPAFGVRYRLLFSWLLTSAVPLLALVLVLASPRGKTNVIGVAIAVAIVALVLGALVSVLLVRAIAAPLHDVVDALNTVAAGSLDVAVPVQDPGEIGLVQSGFNQMVEGLRERERIQDLFGRHVGSAVAAQAISSGVTLRGESLDVVALFVDITASTVLTRVTEPVEFVAMLNRFFEVVVDEVEQHGGLLNKFEGDAALCVFGAPAELDDPATAALATARAIRDRVAATGEFHVGIGVASGPVIAGQIGAASRLEYTVIGDAVNEAARLTELAKRVDGWILASEQCVDVADPVEQARWVRGRTLRLRGRDTLTHSYRAVDGPPAPPPPSLPRRIGDVARAMAELPPLPRDL
jgi:adenylate cyclase